MASLLCIQYAIKIFFVNCGHYFLQYLVFLQNLSSPCVLCLERLRFNIFAQFRCVILFIIHSGLSKDEMLSTLRQKNYFLWRWEMAILGSCAIKGIKGALIADGYNVTQLINRLVGFFKTGVKYSNVKCLLPRLHTY